ncbi:Ribonuclease H-like protein [Dioscorea alata]|uniref:Ribonuclease H-like protein n=1 Tax=Dioscorea alata TaxID=55571 RepID=A0ACB7TPQ8_DIOAL|nr:Ribonuclease H-like protein [Dioscorea alata]
MDRASAIAKSFGKNEGQYKECQLHRPLYEAGHYLTTEFCYANPMGIIKNSEMMDVVLETPERFVPDASCQDKINSQMSIYQNVGGIFGRNLAIRNQNLKSQAEWWKTYGASTPELLDFAIKVLSLTCSTSSCKRNWSIFEYVHIKKRNRLNQQKLNDLVFVKYNRALKRRCDDHDHIDSISLQDIDEANEWLMGKLEEKQGDKEIVFGDDDLTWDAVERAVGVDENAYNTRGGRKRTNVIASSSRPSKGKDSASSTSLRTPLILRDGDDEEENLGDDYLYKENEKFKVEIVDIGSDDNDDGLDDFDDSQ